MPKTSNQNSGIAMIIFVIIFLSIGFLSFGYLENQGVKEISALKSQISGLETDSLKNTGAVSSESASAKGQDILELLLVLQKIKLDIDFFQNPDFKNLKDFYQKIEIKEEEKGNPEPFRQIKSE